MLIELGIGITIVGICLMFLDKLFPLSGTFILPDFFIREDFSTEKEYKRYLKTLSKNQLLAAIEKKNLKIRGKAKGAAFYQQMRRTLVLEKFPKITKSNSSTQTD